MAFACFSCNKKTVIGSQHRHRPGVAGRQHMRKVVHTPKHFKPNLHYAYYLEGAEALRVRLCTKCRRTLIEQGKVRSFRPGSGLLKPASLNVKVEEAKAIKTLKAEKPKVSMKPEDVDIAIKRVISGKEPSLAESKKVKEDKASVEDLVGKK